MKNTRSTGLFLSALLIALGSVSLTKAHADDYSDVSQLLRNGKFSEALSKADQFLASQPKDVQMRFLKGVVQRESGKTSDAIATFVRLTEDYPELPEPYNNLAVLYAGQGQYDRARTALEMAIRTNPSYSTAHENLGDVYAKLASQAYNKALQLDNSNSAVAPKLALIKELFSPNPIGAKIQRSTPLAPVAPVAPPPMIAAMTPGKTPTATATPTTPPVPPTLPAMKQPTTATSSAPAGSSGSAATAQVAAATAQSVAATPPAPVAPVVAAAPPVDVSAPVPTSAAANTAVSSNAVKDVESVVQAWAAAWSARDVKAYLGHYGKDFDPSGGVSRAKWEEERRLRISSKSTISVKLENLSVRVNGTKATAKFRQDYKANGLAVSSRKVLELSKAGDRWRIVKESVEN